MIPTLLSVLVFVSLNTFIFQFDIAEVSAASINDQVKAKDYLETYGYMPITEENIENGMRISKEVMTADLKNSQKLNNTEVTGNLELETVDKTKQLRCGNADKIPDHLRKKRYVLTKYKWNKKKITYKMNNTYQNANYPVPSFVIESDLKRALDLWQPYIPMQLSIHKDSRSEPDVFVHFQTKEPGKRYIFDGPNGRLGYATFPSAEPDQHSILLIDGEESWYFQKGRYGDPKGLSFYQTLVHEIGHTLGLNHSDDKSAVMYPYRVYFGPDSGFKLNSDDKQGIEAQYHYKPTLEPTRITEKRNSYSSTAPSILDPRKIKLQKKIKYLESENSFYKP